MIAFGASWLACRAAIPLASQLGWFDRPDGHRKLHSSPVPLLGGVAIISGFASALVIIGTCFDWPFTTSLGHWFGLGLTSLLLCLLGLYDDLHHLRPKMKLLWQMIALVPYLVLTPALQSIQLLGMPLPLGPCGWLFTGFFLIAAINALNLIDGVDGLAGSTSLVIIVAAGVHAWLSGSFELAALLLVAAASVGGFLSHNWAPARIYLGDSGSHLLGFWVGAFSLASSTKTVTGLTLFVPVVLLSLPAFDTALAILRRSLISRSIAEPDRLHIHHRLLSRGLAPWQVTLLITSLSATMAAFALTGSYLQQEWLSWGGCGLVLIATVALEVCGQEEWRLVREWWAGTLEPVITDEEIAEKRRTATLTLSAVATPLDAPIEHSKQTV